MASVVRFSIAGAIGAGIVALVGAILSPSLAVTTVTASGVDSATRTEAELIARRFVEAHATLAGSPRLFLVNPARLEDDIRRALPRVSTARVLRRLPATIELHLQEKVPAAYLELASGGVYALDGDGRVIAEATADDARQSQLPRIRDLRTSVVPVHQSDPVLSARVVSLLHDVVVRLPERFSVTVTELTIPSIGTEEVSVQTSRGWSLLLDALRPLDEQLGALEKVIAEELGPQELDRLEYVDLRIPGKVYYRTSRSP